MKFKKIKESRKRDFQWRVDTKGTFHGSSTPTVYRASQVYSRFVKRIGSFSKSVLLGVPPPPPDRRQVVGTKVFFARPWCWMGTSSSHIARGHGDKALISNSMLPTAWVASWSWLCAYARGSGPPGTPHFTKGGGSMLMLVRDLAP